MFDIGVTKIAIIGAIALVVIGPEKLPAVARTLGALLARARGYVADVKAEVNRSMQLDELKKMKDSFVNAAQDVENSIQTSASEFQASWQDGDESPSNSLLGDSSDPYPAYRHPNKRWRLKQTAVPSWYKARAGVRTKALSGAARVARFRPRKVV
jgi:sec-independent protein translocase protein TatB